MKHLIKNNQIVMSGIPGTFTRENGQAFWGGYQNMTELHHADGWREEEMPEYDPVLQDLGEPYFDAENDIVKYNVVDKELPAIADVRKEKLAALSSVMNDFSLLISRAKLLYPTDEGLNTIIETIKTVKAKTVNDIETLELQALIKYRIKPEDIAYLKGLLEPYML